MTTRALILAGGGRTGWRWPWPNDRGHTRHMVPIHGEPLIHRTQRQLADRGVTDVRVFADADCAEYVSTGTHEIPRPVDRDWVQEWEPSQHLWLPKGRTIILYGDVFFTYTLMDIMCADTGDPWNVYARHGGSSGHTGKWYGEMFGWVFTDTAAPFLIGAQREAIRAKESGEWNRALGWEVYRIALGQWPGHHYKGAHFVDWDDASDDFDFPDDFDTWAALNGGLL